ncbi:hypothetical protein EVAR_92867_1 [Eumeta japonica]|uniref:Uncharacterized protein n=1 Tax=Eumeta variegata TaxID=151549 RepID=A0A4C1TA08_EUMVA|nr:hypothetical protein EVAR_92867_1 [Eumeta japonica]
MLIAHHKYKTFEYDVLHLVTIGSDLYDCYNYLPPAEVTESKLQATRSRLGPFGRRGGGRRPYEVSPVLTITPAVRARTFSDDRDQNFEQICRDG